MSRRLKYHLVYSFYCTNDIGIPTNDVLSTRTWDSEDLVEIASLREDISDCLLGIQFFFKFPLGPYIFCEFYKTSYRRPHVIMSHKRSTETGQLFLTYANLY